MPSNHLILCSPLLLPPSTFPSIRVFSNESILASSDQGTGVSASASVLPMNIQNWFPLGWSGWISCSPRDSQESSPTPQFKSINSWHSAYLGSIPALLIASCEIFRKLLNLSEPQFPHYWGKEKTLTEDRSWRWMGGWESELAEGRGISAKWSENLFLLMWSLGFLFFFWFCGFQDLSSLTRNQTHGPCSRSIESQPLEFLASSLVSWRELGFLGQTPRSELPF